MLWSIFNINPSKAVDNTIEINETLKSILIKNTMSNNAIGIKLQYLHQEYPLFQFQQF